MSDGGGKLNGGWDPDASNNVSVFGGKGGMVEEALEMDGREGEEEVTPKNRIRAKTTVTVVVSERVEWLDDLF